jgi:hypothetical protein
MIKLQNQFHTTGPGLLRCLNNNLAVVFTLPYQALVYRFFSAVCRKHFFTGCQMLALERSKHSTDRTWNIAGSALAKPGLVNNLYYTCLYIQFSIFTVTE